MQRLLKFCYAETRHLTHVSTRDWPSYNMCLARTREPIALRWNNLFVKVIWLHSESWVWVTSTGICWPKWKFGFWISPWTFVWVNKNMLREICDWAVTWTRLTWTYNLSIWLWSLIWFELGRNRGGRRVATRQSRPDSELSGLGLSKNMREPSFELWLLVWEFSAMTNYTTQ